MIAIFEGALILSRSFNDPVLVVRQLRQFRQYFELLFAGRQLQAVAAGAKALPPRRRERRGSARIDYCSFAFTARSPCPCPSARRISRASAPITLPMSFMPAAPVSLMAASIAAAISASDICLGR